MVEYQARFLFWCGLLLFSFKLGSGRQLDFELRDLDLAEQLKAQFPQTPFCLGG
jgi:hypothetical protein